MILSFDPESLFPSITQSMPALATSCIACDHDGLDRQPAILMPFVAERALYWSPVEIAADWGLRDLPTGWAQALCCTLHCPSCGMVFLDMRFDEAEMRRLYADYRGPSYEAQREHHEPGYRARNQRLLKGDTHIQAVEDFLRPWLPANPAILDWGGDSGINTPLRDQARLHHVLDISSKEVITGAKTIDSVNDLNTKYDLVVLSNVLEHLPFPRPFLQGIAHHMRAMAPQVRIYVEVPFESLMRSARTNPSAWIAKRHWHEHINFFSEEALHCLLQACGFRVLASQQIACSSNEIQLGFACELK